MKLEKILVPTDLSGATEPVLAAAIALALTFEAHVTLMHVWETGRADAVARAGAESANAEAQRAEQVRARLRELLGKSAPGARVRPAIVEGEHAPQVICDYARDHEYDLIAIARRSAQDADAYSLGHVAQHVLSCAPCRVMLLSQP